MIRPIKNTSFYTTDEAAAKLASSPNPAPKNFGSGHSQGPSHGHGHSQGARPGRGSGHSPRFDGAARKFGPQSGGRRAFVMPGEEKAPARPHTAQPQSDALRLIPLGGLEEVGRNMSFFEYKDEIVIIDMGLQFPEEETPGIDFIIPNVSYLEPKKKNIKAVVLTHGHYDHIGAIPYLTMKLGSVPIYTTNMTKAIIEKRQIEFTNAPKLDIEVVKNRDRVRVGKYFELEFFGVAHTIPDTMGVLVKTPVGNMVHFADFRIEYDAKGNPQGLEDYERIAKQGIHTFMVDSTNASEAGRSISERVVEKNLEELFLQAEGRIIVGIFASLLTRIAEIINIAEKLGRVVILNGRSMKDNVQIAQNLGYMKVRKGGIVPMEELHKYRDNKVLVLTTGAQGEQQAGLMKIVTGEHRFVTIKPGDMLVFSASVIPGNERGVQILKDNLARQGADVYTSGLIDYHASGHAPEEDLKLVMKILKPKFIVPVHGLYFMRCANRKNAQAVGIPKENVIMMDNGQVAEITPDKIKITGEQVPAYYVMVDGLGVGDVSEIVLRDRKLLSQEGMVVIITTIDKATGRVLKNPDIISRGFIYLKDNKDLLAQVRKRARFLVEKDGAGQINTVYLKEVLRDEIGKFLFQKTQRRPMVLPVVIEV